MKLALLFSLFVLPTTVLSQNEMDTTKWKLEIYDGDSMYVRIPSAGDIAREKGDLKEAISAFKIDYSNDPTDHTNTYNLACALALRDNADSAFHYLNIALINDSTVWPLNDPDFYYITKDSRWSDIENSQIKKVEAVNGKYANVELSKELWKMKIKDQAFYYQLEIAEEKTDNNPLIVNAIWELKEIINQENVARIEEIIEEHGWPKMSVIGGNAASTVFLIIQHADIDIQKKYLPLMTEAAENGEASWSSLALLIDRTNLREGKKQIYGSQIYGNQDGTYYVKDLVDPEYVNQRRKEVGLGPIEEYVSQWGVEWTIEQQEK